MSIHRLSPAFVDRVTRAGMYADGQGLYLQVGEGGGAKSWIFRYSRSRFGKPGDVHMGLGAVHTIRLHDARELARACRVQLLQGVDPVEARKSDRLGNQLAAAKDKTFEFCGDEYIAHKSLTWVPGTAKKAKSHIRRYLYPKLGKLPIGAIDHIQVVQVIKPLWVTKTPTARMVLWHLYATLEYAKAMDRRTGDNPASLKGKLGKLLPAMEAIHTVKHHASLPYQEIGTFMAQLRTHKPRINRMSVTRDLLEFIILTCVRLSQAREMRWNEIDDKKCLWTCPWQRTKTGRKKKYDHLVP